MLLFFVWGTFSYYSISIKKNDILTDKLRKNEVSISMKWGLCSLESLDSNSQKIEGFYTTDKFINDITIVFFS